MPIEFKLVTFNERFSRSGRAAFPQNCADGRFLSLLFVILEGRPLMTTNYYIFFNLSEIVLRASVSKFIILLTLLYSFKEPFHVQCVYIFLLIYYPLSIA